MNKIVKNSNKNNKFILAQDCYYKIAKKELKNGKKESHWMWFIFPQLRGLGQSETSEYYGLEDRAETEEFYNDKKLQKRLCDLLNILLDYDETVSIKDVFGEIDAMKLHSCLTLFYIVTGKEIFDKVLKRYYNGNLDKKTIILLGERDNLL